MCFDVETGAGGSRGSKIIHKLYRSVELSISYKLSITYSDFKICITFE